MAVIYMERSLLDGLTEADIKKIVDENSGGDKYGKLQDYYEGKHDILQYTKKDRTAPSTAQMAMVAAKPITSEPPVKMAIPRGASRHTASIHRI